MRLYTFEAAQRTRLGAELRGRLVDLNAAHAARLDQRRAVLAPSMLELVRGGPVALKNARLAAAFAAKHPPRLRRQKMVAAARRVRDSPTDRLVPARSSSTGSMTCRSVRPCSPPRLSSKKTSLHFRPTGPGGRWFRWRRFRGIAVTPSGEFVLEFPEECPLRLDYSP